MALPDPCHVEHRPRGANGPRPGRRRSVVGQQVAQRGRADRRHRRQRHRVRLLRQRHGTTAARPARSESASATCANDTVSSPARSATVRATCETLCSPRALRAPDRSFEPSSVSASGARSGPRAGRGRRRSACPGRRHPERHGRRRLARDAGEQLVGVRPAEGHHEIEAVQQRRRDPAAVPGAGDGAAGAGALVDALAAGAGVHGGDEEEGRREGDGAAGAAHPDHPLLEGLAERLEGGHGELPELVEEEDPVGGETHLTGPERPAAASDQRDDGGPVVRGPERRAVEEGAVGQRTARGRVDAGDGQRLLGGERREQPGQALGQHGLARPGRPDHEEVVAPGRGHLERPATDRLAPDVGQVRFVGGRRRARRRRRLGPRCLAAQDPGQVPERRGAVDVAATDERGLSHVAERHHEPERRRGVGQGDHAGDVAQRAVEPELAAEGEGLGRGGVDLAGGDEQPHRDGEVEPGAALPHARGREVDGDPSQGPGETARQDGGAHPVAGLAHRGVGQADDGEAGQAVGDVDLDRDGAPDGAAQRGGGDRGEHAR